MKSKKPAARPAIGRARPAQQKFKFDPERAVEKLEAEVRIFIKKKCANELAGEPLPEFIDIHLNHLCRLVIDPVPLVYAGAESEAYRTIFISSFVRNPTLFSKIMHRITLFYDLQTPTWKALTSRRRIWFADKNGKVRTKDVEKATSSELAAYIAHEFTEFKSGRIFYIPNVEPRSVAKSRQRLANGGRRRTGADVLYEMVTEGKVSGKTKAKIRTLLRLKQSVLPPRPK